MRRSKKEEQGSAPGVGPRAAPPAAVDRSAGTVDLGVPFTALIALNFTTWAPDEVPAELAAVPVMEPDDLVI